MTTNAPDEKTLQTTSFVVHATRGLIRDQRTRRGVMIAAVIGALVLIVAGSTFLRGFLKPRQHTLAFIIFWGACGWLTVLALLLALFDLLIIRAEARKARRLLSEQAATQVSEGAASANKQSR